MGRLSWALPTLLMAAIWVHAQPVPAPTSGDAPCEEWPRETQDPDLSHPDDEGFHALFNGVDFTGWWLNCKTPYGNAPSPVGPIFRVDTARKAIYSTQNGLTGGVLMTKAKFGDYEVRFEYWPDWGNEAVWLNRADTSARRSYNTTLAYSTGTSLGGVLGVDLSARDFRPFVFGQNESTLVIPGRSDPERSNWTHITRKRKEAGERFDCPSTGCTQEDWRRLWNFDDWNEIRVQFHGGKDPNDPIHARSWFRKPGATDWVPLSADTTLRKELKPGYLGLVVDGGGFFGGARGTWYRNIRWTPWTPITTVPVGGIPAPASRRPVIRFDGARQGVRITFAEPASDRALQVRSLDGKSMAELRDVGAEAFLNTAGWKPGLYFLRVDAKGRRDWAQLLIP